MLWLEGNLPQNKSVACKVESEKEESEKSVMLYKCIELYIVTDTLISCGETNGATVTAYPVTKVRMRRWENRLIVCFLLWLWPWCRRSKYSTWLYCRQKTLNWIDITEITKMGSKLTTAMIAVSVLVITLCSMSKGMEKEYLYLLKVKQTKRINKMDLKLYHFISKWNRHELIYELQHGGWNCNWNPVPVAVLWPESNIGTLLVD